MFNIEPSELLGLAFTSLVIAAIVLTIRRRRRDT
jgi:hypothetical protein